MVGIFISGMVTGMLLGIVLASRYVNRKQDAEEAANLASDFQLPSKSKKTMWDE